MGTNSHIGTKRLSIFDIDSLKDRRLKAITRFVKKSKQNERFSSRWFPKNDNERQNALKNKKKLLIRKSNFDRLMNGPLDIMRKMLNESV